MTFRIPIICDSESREDDETIDLQLRVPSAFQSCVCLDRIAMMRIDIIGKMYCKHVNLVITQRWLTVMELTLQPVQ